jgi:MSHA biogenesis protein MshQ
MAGFDLDYEADFRTPFGVVRQGTGRGALVQDTGYLTTGTSFTVPLGATYVEVEGVGGGGQGGFGNSAGGGGGAAIARSSFKVSAGDTIAYVLGTGGKGVGNNGINTAGAGGSGSASSATYNGTVVMQAAPGSGGLTTGPGVGGTAANSVGRDVVIPGQNGQSTTGGVAGANRFGGSTVNSYGGLGGTTGAGGTGYGAGGGSGSGSGLASATVAGAVRFRFYES